MTFCAAAGLRNNRHRHPVARFGRGQ